MSQTVTSAELEQRAAQGLPVSAADLANARAVEAAARDLERIAKLRQAELDKQERTKRAVEASKAVKEKAARLSGKSEVARAIHAINQAVRQFFDAGAAYNLAVNELRSEATDVQRIEATADTGITLTSDRFIVDGLVLDTFDFGEEAIQAYFQEAIDAAKAPEVI